MRLSKGAFEFAPRDTTVDTRSRVAAGDRDPPAALPRRRNELDHDDPEYQVSILMRVVKGCR